MGKHLKIRAIAKPALTITRIAIRARKLVYIARANNPHGYPWGRSRIVYIGTTKAGAHRVASSAASKADLFLSNWGVRQLDFHVVQSTKKQNVETWKELERDLLIIFKEVYGRVPAANTQGKNLKRSQLSGYFRDHNLRSVIAQYS